MKMVLKIIQEGIYGRVDRECMEEGAGYEFDRDIQNVQRTIRNMK